MELTIEHLAAYLPYNLSVLRPDGKTIVPLVGIENNILIFREYNNEDLTYGDMVKNKPILRPLSDLTKEIEHNGEKFVPIDELDNYHDFSTLNYKDIISNPLRYPYTVVKKLHEWHFDTFGLIDAELAIDINELNNKNGK